MNPPPGRQATVASKLGKVTGAILFAQRLGLDIERSKGFLKLMCHRGHQLRSKTGGIPRGLEVTGALIQCS